MASFDDLVYDSIHEYVVGNVLDRNLIWSVFSQRGKKVMKGTGKTIRTLVRTSFSASRGPIVPHGTYGTGEVNQETKLTFPLVCLYDTAEMSVIEAKRNGGWGSRGTSLLFASRVDGMREGMDDQLEEAIFQNGEASLLLYEGLRTACDDGTFATNWGGKALATNAWSQSTVVAQAGANLTKSDLDAVFDPMWEAGADVSNIVATCPLAVCTLIKGLHHGETRINQMKASELHGGFQYVMTFNGIPIIMSPKAFAATLFAADLSHLWVECNPRIFFETVDDPQSNSDQGIIRISVDANMVGDRGKNYGRLHTIS